MLLWCLLLMNENMSVVTLVMMTVISAPSVVLVIRVVILFVSGICRLCDRLKLVMKVVMKVLRNSLRQTLRLLGILPVLCFLRVLSGGGSGLLLTRCLTVLTVLLSLLVQLLVWKCGLRHLWTSWSVAVLGTVFLSLQFILTWIV